jgi:hypothetical protein
MLILLCHEMGHYLSARKHGVRASLPYFLPAPPFPLLPIGTFGAFIRMRSVPTDRRTLFDIGAAGPWGGVLVAIPAVIIGLALSKVRPLSPFDGGLYLGDSFLFSLLTRLVLGVSGDDVNIELHPIAGRLDWTVCDILKLTSSGAARWWPCHVCPIRAFPSLDLARIPRAYLFSRLSGVGRLVLLGCFVITFGD